MKTTKAVASAFLEKAAISPGPGDMTIFACLRRLMTLRGQNVAVHDSNAADPKADPAAIALPASVFL